MSLSPPDRAQLATRIEPRRPTSDAGGDGEEVLRHNPVWRTVVRKRTIASSSKNPVPIVPRSPVSCVNLSVRLVARASCVDAEAGDKVIAVQTVEWSLSS